MDSTELLATYIAFFIFYDFPFLIIIILFRALITRIQKRKHFDIYKEIPKKLSAEEKRHLYYLDKNHKDLIKIYDEMPYESKIVLLNDIYEYHNDIKIDEKYSPFMFSVNTDSKIYYVDVEHFNLLYLFFTLPLYVQEDIFNSFATPRRSITRV